MKVVVDTNVLLSAIFFGGNPGRLLSAWQSGALTFVLSPEILDEYRPAGRELSGRYPDLEGPLESVLALIAMNATIVDAPRLEGVVCDPDDDKFLACAAASGTEFVVSGDKDLLRVSGWHGIEVLTPRQFKDRYLNETADR